ncbi:MAG: UDP-N-acetylmuramoyl-L-alanine--D-glutamate ligase, partial [Sphingomonadales bacterium]|nr:UDP-N-acetylmuramoyl-L-alanine--D-glutamate ligase [Sphingomonadales bacterium]
MIAATAYQGQNIGVFGLARSGLASVDALDAGGAHVFAWDDNENARKAAPFEVHDLYEMDFSILDGLVIAPGVPLTHPAPHALVKKARAANVPILGDIELFARSRDGIPSHDLVAITGTNGKSTTTALMSHVVHCSGRPAIAAGNIGTGVMGIEALTQDGVYVFELSSFQIELTHSLSADVAVLLNISPDHLDRHGDMEGYVNAKRRLFEMQKMDAVAVIGVDDDYGRSIAAGLPQRAV